jgi:hypothetical protein
VRLSADTLIDWKRSMVDEGLRSKTIQDSKLAPAIYSQGCKTNSFRPTLPTASLDAGSKQSDKKRSFTDDEGKIILRAALAEDDRFDGGCLGLELIPALEFPRLADCGRKTSSKIDDIWCNETRPGGRLA